ncbi:MAG: glycoside hydrolase family 13 protein [Rubricoccaceae bacterium]|nr:glycoside hydrolase family 13 protein [Rubricoccaceae bacterium]
MVPTPRHSHVSLPPSLRAVRTAGVVGLFALLVGCADAQAPAGEGSGPVAENVPDWATDAVFYQIFPERFRNGDPSNDPTRASLEFPVDGRVPASWQISPWTGDWYARDAWEEEKGDDFYEHGVFDRRYGGDLQGVIDELDYLADLGINAIYFNPVFYARSLHKYDGNTFHHVDPHFGPDPAGDFALMAEETSDPDTWHWTEADKLFLELIEQARARGIRVVIDGVFNHTGRDFFAFEDLRERQQDSPYADWYIVRAFDDPATPENEFDYKGWWDVDTLPEFADTEDGLDLHPGPKAYVFDATARWMDPDGDGDPSDGIDGWRLDVANEVPIQFWVDWNAHVRDLNPEAYTVTELWEEGDDFLREGGFSATMNYHAFAYPVKGFLIDGEATPGQFAEMLNERRESYHPAFRPANQNLVDSHDTDRLASMIVNAKRLPYENAERYDFDVGSRVSPRWNEAVLVRAPTEAEREIQRLVALFQMTYVGAPMIYYGTEAGMWGADDPDDRMPMVWPDLAYDPQCADPLGRERACDEVAFDHDLHAFYQAAIALRNEHPALRRGDFRVLLTDDDRDLFAFARTHGDDAFVVVMNRSDAAHSVRVEKPAAGRYGSVFTTTDEPSRVQDDAQGLVLEVPPRTGLVLHRTGA